MQNTTYSNSKGLPFPPLEPFGELEKRYLSLPLASRGASVLKDADPALQAAERILQFLADHPRIKQTFAQIRQNHLLTGKMRASEAKNLLMEGEDFIEVTRHKLAAWRKTMQRLADGEGIVNIQNKEYIAGDAPLALAIAGSAGIGNYLSIIQLVLAELIKNDAGNAAHYQSAVAEIRRCATVLGDCEYASCLHTIIH